MTRAPIPARRVSYKHASKQHRRVRCGRAAHLLSVITVPGPVGLAIGRSSQTGFVRFSDEKNPRTVEALRSDERTAKYCIDARE
jgi:hypothetical protein